MHTRNKANQVAVSTPQQFEQIVNYGHQNVINFYDAIYNLFRLFNDLTDHDADLEYSGTRRTILHQVHLEPTSFLNDQQQQIAEQIFNTMRDLIRITSAQYRRILPTIRHQLLDNITEADFSVERLVPENLRQRRQEAHE